MSSFSPGDVVYNVPCGKRLHNELENHDFPWVNHFFYSGIPLQTVSHSWETQVILLDLALLFLRNVGKPIVSNSSIHGSKSTIVGTSHRFGGTSIKLVQISPTRVYGDDI